MLDPRPLFVRFARGFDDDCSFDRARQSRRDSSNRWRESAAKAEISSRMNARERDRDVAFESNESAIIRVDRILTDSELSVRVFSLFPPLLLRDNCLA